MTSMNDEMRAQIAEMRKDTVAIMDCLDRMQAAADEFFGRVHVPTPRPNEGE